MHEIYFKIKIRPPITAADVMDEPTQPYNFVAFEGLSQEIALSVSFAVSRCV